jgi:hypothetical protein
MEMPAPFFPMEDALGKGEKSSRGLVAGDGKACTAIYFVAPQKGRIATE